MNRMMGIASLAMLALCFATPSAAKAPTAATPATKAVVAPSGADTARRSKQCNAEAAKRGLHDSGLQAFRKGCLASAAPVGAIETTKTPTKPTPAKPKLESMTNTPPK